ncbi:MAG: DnaA ATPase domain-containing protein, partial [Candidatus Rokuibacteriota bacterium]
MAGAEHLWGACVGVLRNEVPDSIWNTWLASARPQALVDHRLFLTVPSPLAKERIEARYLELVTDVVSDVAGEPHEVVLEVRTDPAVPDEDDLDLARPGELEFEGPPLRTGGGPSPKPASTAGGMPEVALNPKYTFENFVIGESNRFAHAAALAVAEAPPSKAYNPLFIYGGVGLGKTHLLVAIGHHMHRLSPRLRVKYVTSESFMAEFIKAVRERQGYQFAARHRDIDVLLVDDIQFLAKREETQTEFFHTFNALHEKERQIVIASDRPPQELGMEERLQSRFRLGLCVDVQPPDLETRIAILQLKA